MLAATRAEVWRGRELVKEWHVPKKRRPPRLSRAWTVGSNVFEPQGLSFCKGALMAAARRRLAGLGTQARPLRQPGGLAHTAGRLGRQAPGSPAANSCARPR